MSDAPDPIAGLAVGLNEDAKSKRKAKASTEERTHGADSAVDDELATAAQSLADSGRNAEQQHVTAVDRMEAMADELELEKAGLVDDVRDFLLDTIKARPKPWSATSQQEQRDVAAACEHAGRELVRKIVEVVSAHGTDPVRVLLTKITLGDDIVISGKVKTFDDEEAERAVATLHHARGKHVMLTVASVEDYQGGTEAQTDADEPNFAFEGDPPE